MIKKRVFSKKTRFTAAAAALIVCLGPLVGCGFGQGNLPKNKYIGDHHVLRYYLSNPTGNPYAGQTCWVTIPNPTWIANTAIMGAEMNSSTLPSLVRPINVGFSKWEPSYDPKNLFAPPTYKNAGDVTDTYAAFELATSITVHFDDGTQLVYDSDAHSNPRKKVSDHFSKIPWNSINSTKDNALSNPEKSFHFVLSGGGVINDKTYTYKISKISFQIRDGVRWSNNLGQNTNQPVTPTDFWYGLQTLHLSTDVNFRYSHGGSSNKDSVLNTDYGAQLPTSASGSASWSSLFSQFSVDVAKFNPGDANENAFIAPDPTHPLGTSVNIPFLKNLATKDIVYQAYYSMFLSSDYFVARSEYAVNATRKNPSDDSLTSKYGFYDYPEAGFSKLYYATPYTIERYDSSIAIYDVSRGFYTGKKFPYGPPKKIPTAVVYYFTKQTDTFPSTQFFKYVQGSTVQMLYSTQDDHIKNVINSNPQNYGVNYVKTILNRIATSDTTWNAILPKEASGGQDENTPYFNTEYCEAMYGQSLKSIMSTSGPQPYMQHYFQAGAALRSDISSAINWYTAMLTINKGSSSNWGSHFPPDLKVPGTQDSLSSKNAAPVQSEYSYAWNGKAITNHVSVSLDDNKQSFIKTFDKGHGESFYAAKFAQLQANVKTTLDEIESQTGFHFTTQKNPPEPKQRPNDWGIQFELPIRSYHNRPTERAGLEGMREAINALDPRLHATATLKFAPGDLNTQPRAVHTEHEKFDAGYVNNWVDNTLPRLESWRYTTRSDNTLMQPDPHPGIWGFLNKMVTNFSFGGLLGFSVLDNPQLSHITNAPNLLALQNFVTGTVANLFANDVAVPTTNPIFAENLDKSVTGVASVNSIATAFHNLNLKNLYQSSSYKLVPNTGANPIGLKGFDAQYNLYQQLSQKSSLTPTEKKEFNNLNQVNVIFDILVQNMVTGMVSYLQSNREADTVAIMTGIDSYFGRSIEFLQRKIPNPGTLPIKIWKAWLKIPISNSGVDFINDYQVS